MVALGPEGAAFLRVRALEGGEGLVVGQDGFRNARSASLSVCWRPMRRSTTSSVRVRRHSMPPRRPLVDQCLLLFVASRTLPCTPSRLPGPAVLVASSVTSSRACCLLVASRMAPTPARQCQQHQRGGRGRTPPPAPAPCSAARTSAAGTPPTAGTPAPARPPGSAARPARSRWPSRSGGCGPSPGAFITIQSSSPRTSCRQLRRLGRRGSPRASAAPPPCSAACSASAAPPRGSAAASRSSAASFSRSRSNGVRAGQQLVQQHAQRVDVAARVDVQAGSSSACSGLMYSSVPTTAPKPGDQRLLGQRLPGRLGDAEVDHLRHRLAVVRGRPARWTA